MRKIIHWLLFIFLFAACEQSTDWQIEPTESKPVIEAILTNVNKIQEIKLTQSFAELDSEISGISNANVTVTANQKTYQFIHNNEGIYKSEEPFEVFENLPYDLKVEIDGTEYIAQSKLSEVTPLPEIEFKKYNKTDSLEIDDANVFNPNQQAMYEVDIDWSHITTEGTTKVKLLFYTFSTLDISQVNPIRREPIAFPKGSIVQVTKFGLNDDFAAYLRALNIETDWNGSFFYTSGFDLPTNINNDGLGFFSTCAVVKRTVIARE